MSKKIRAQQIADVIRQQLVICLQKEISDPRLANLNITRVTLADDFGVARIDYILVDPAELKPAEKALEKATGFLRRYLANHTSLRYVPQLRFNYDISLEYAERIGRLLKEDDDESKDP